METDEYRFQKQQNEYSMLAWQKKFYELAKWQKWSTVVIAIATVVNVIVAYLN